MKIHLIAIFLFISSITHAQDFMKLGDDCYKNGNYNCAYDNYIKVVNANLTGISISKAELYFKIGYCLSVNNTLADAKKWLLRSLAEGENLHANWELAYVNYRLFAFDSAVKYYRRAYGLSTQAADKKAIAYWLGVSYYDLKNHASARQYFEECLKIDSTFHNANNLLGLSLFQQKEYAAAERSFRKGLRIEKDSACMKSLNKGIGDVYYAQGNYGESINYYRTGLSYGPGDINLIACIGDAHLERKRPDSAEYYYMTVFNTVLAEKGKTDSAYLGLITNTIIAMHLSAKDTARAILFFPTLIQYCPGCEEVAPYIEMFQEVVDGTPKDTSMVAALATAYYQSKNYAKAAGLFGKQADKLKGMANKAMAYYNQAFCYYMNKENGKSKESVQKSLALLPNYEDAKKLKAELEKPTG